MSIVVKKYRSTYVLTGESIDDMANIWAPFVPESAKTQRVNRDKSQRYHITLFDPSENVINEVFLSVEDNVNIAESITVFPFGLGHQSANPNEAWYVVVYCKWANNLRKSMGLSDKDLHITLGFHNGDVHGFCKGIKTIFETQSTDIYKISPMIIDICSTCDCSILDVEVATYLTRYIINSIDKSICSKLPFSLLRQIGKWAMSCRIFDLVDEIGHNLWSHGVLFGIKLLLLKENLISSKQTVDDVFHLKRALIADTLPLKVQTGSKDIYEEGKLVGQINEILFRNCASFSKHAEVLSIDKVTNTFGFFKLPRNFSVIRSTRKLGEGVLAGCAIPTTMDNVSALFGLGISKVITVHELDLRQGSLVHCFESMGIQTFHFPVVDRTPPSMSQLKEMVALIHGSVSKGDGVAVHCQGGVGRTNTVICAYTMWSTRCSAADAIKIVSDQRKTILSTSQEDLLRKYWQLIMTEESTQPITNETDLMIVPKSSDKVPIVAGVAKAEARSTAGVPFPEMIMLCGLAASGKSTFSNSMINAFPQMITRINRDEMRKKGECENVLQSAVKRKQNGLVIIDTCNLTASKRLEWLEMAFKPRTWCIFFDFPVEVCKYRITRRQGHPTIPSGNAGITILDSMFKQLQAPQLSEGFERIIHLYSEEDLNGLLEEWKVDVVIPELESNALKNVVGNVGGEEDDKPLLKFPRTPHAVNLGSATRDDKIASHEDITGLFTAVDGLTVVVEEKVDGANMGISINRNGTIVAQNRSHFVSSSYHPQFALLDKWIHRHSDDLWEILEPGRHILYGEWLYATHSVYYSTLPDWFIAYDIFDRKENAFLPRDIVRAMISRTKISHVPIVFEGEISCLDHLISLVDGPSAYSEDGRREGIVIRLYDAHRLVQRFKIVRNDFIAGNERWNRSSKLALNKLAINY